MQVVFSRKNFVIIIGVLVLSAGVAFAQNPRAVKSGQSSVGQHAGSDKGIIIINGRSGPEAGKSLKSTGSPGIRNEGGDRGIIIIEGSEERVVPAGRGAVQHGGGDRGIIIIDGSEHKQ